ncbi:MAG TPA: GTPase HflX [Gemmatimonadaceae bacterium]|nr:GTPase HflX [Gemmatimonadaceae bacterium]
MGPYVPAHEPSGDLGPIARTSGRQGARERVVLVGAPRKGGDDDRHAADHLDELARLADTAGATVAATVIQRVVAPTPGYYIGRGKVLELQQVARQHGATLAVFDEDLSPAQGRNLERALGLRVMDRSELILDIFATRARSKEARMQVELAQLEYLLPRLARMWVHLSRIRGGIGLRGPGETQLETDRRMIRRRIATLKRKLEHVTRHRETIRGGRQHIPTAALVGYTNAGKSSLLKALTGADTFIEDRLFATLDTLTRELAIPSAFRDRGPARRRIRLVDTVGFIRKLPHHLVASFRATLEEARDADLLLHVIDASHPQWEQQVDVVSDVLAEAGCLEKPVIHVFNKMDRVASPSDFRARVRERYGPAVCVSAALGEIGDLAGVLLRFDEAQRPGLVPS